jgi:3-isopropylmalate/(R)-2-methylmalate dehydratase small subunit
MEPFKRHKGIIATLDRANVDTDQIIAKQFLKSIKRTGFGEQLFYDWRFFSDGKINPGFSLNRPEFKGASILVARNNFGCGSSREHAVWAIQQFGIRVVIAPWVEQNGSRVPGFADIFKNNSAQNALLTIELNPADVDTIFQTVSNTKGLEGIVDLEQQRLSLQVSSEISFSFEIDPAVKNRLMNGLDDISLSLKEEKSIREFEAKHNAQKYY